MGARKELVCCAFSPSVLPAKKFTGTSLFRQEASVNKPIQVKNTMAAKSSNEGNVVPLLVGARVENAEGFGDVRREKGGQSVANKADDQLEPRRASTWARTFGPKLTGGRGRSHDNVGQASCHREEDPKQGKGCERGIGGYDSQEPGRPIGDGENQHPGPSPERLGRVVG